jgi:hypothetical protein
LAELSALSWIEGGMLPFSATPWPRGASIGGDAIARWEGGPATATVSGGWVRHLEDVAIDGERFSYRQGDQLRGSASMSVGIGKTGTAEGHASVQTFSADLGSGHEVPAAGTRVEAGLSLSWAPRPSLGAIVYGGYQDAQGSPRFDDREEDPATAMTPEERELWEAAFPGLAGVPFFGAAEAGIQLRVTGVRLAVLPEISVRVARRGSESSSILASAGARMELRLAGGRFGPRMILVPSGRIRAGRVVGTDGAESDVLGWQIGVGVAVASPR